MTKNLSPEGISYSMAKRTGAGSHHRRHQHGAKQWVSIHTQHVHMQTCLILNIGKNIFMLFQFNWRTRHKPGINLVNMNI